MPYETLQYVFDWQSSKYFQPIFFISYLQIESIDKMYSST